MSTGLVALTLPAAIQYICSTVQSLRINLVMQAADRS